MTSRKLAWGLAGLLAAAAPAAAQPRPASIEGVWASDGCEVQDLGNGTSTAFTRRYEFQATTWTVSRTVFADGACRRPLLTWFLAGEYRLGPTASAAPDAREGDFGFSRFLLTPHDAAALPLLAACGDGRWEVGVQASAAATGCLVLKPLRDCPVDHDIVAVRGDELLPGRRTPDMCAPAGRPTALQERGARRAAAGAAR